VPYDKELSPPLPSEYPGHPGNDALVYPPFRKPCQHPIYAQWCHMDYQYFKKRARQDGLSADFA